MSPQDSLPSQNLESNNVRIISSKKDVFSYALAISAIMTVALLRILIITIQQDMILLKMY